MSDRIRGVGVVGAGGIFAEHARGYAQLASRMRLVGLADLDERRMARASKDFFIPFTTTDYRRLLERDDIDIVDICTPPSLHEEMIAAALDAGKYVLCEKPIAHSLASADRIIETANRFPGRLSIIYQLRYLPEARRALWLRDNGYLGDLCFGRFSRYGAPPVGNQPGKGWWGKWNVAGGGALITQCIHELDMILLLFGAASRVTARMNTFHNAIESEDTFSATIEMQNGAIVTCFGTLAGRTNYTINWDIIGEHGSTHNPWAFKSMDHGRRAKGTREAARAFPGGGPKNLLPGLPGKVLAKVTRKLGIGKRSAPSRHKPYFLDFLASIENGTPVPVSPEEARRSLELCVATYTSAIEERTVSLPLSSECRFYNGISTEFYDGQKRSA
jgi:predicted dehydrogenase